ncbi:hypothetical protein ACFFMN_06555 [Planobispora siamensis]|uniref:Uncharacterized protein n=1 Tax=Planobispora siamensis TaxID=936338 RepID=A0A8J3WNU7_9ACTN|nr:hypothetical protein [Planobispora siamensis]GIH97744.1 hypothetical protein Psi01_83740 [Planobispora siamensis]
MTSQLTHLGTTFINFKNATYQWVDIKRFRLPEAPGDDHDALTLLIEHELYGDTYATDPGDDPHRHGPYWRNRITCGCFEATAADTEELRLRAWAEEHAALPDHLHAELERQLYRPLRTAEALYRLRDLGEDSFHDWGWVLGPFHELVLFDRTARALALVVASDD